MLRTKCLSRGGVGALIGGAFLGAATATLAGAGTAVAPPNVDHATRAPSEHKGVEVRLLGVVPEPSMRKTVGLEGQRLQLRAITIAPGGHIARHSHATRPGLVHVVSGEWVDGRPEGELVFPANGSKAIVEDENTDHWFYNRGDEPATAIVCDFAAVD